MRWGGERESSNVEDRRGGGFGGGGGGRIPGGGRGIGLGTIAIALVAGWIFGINPLTILGVISGGGPEVMQQEPEPAPRPGGEASRPAQDEHSRFVSVVLASTEDAWSEIFRRGQAQYQPPRLVLFSGRTNTACGLGDAAAGPFYCPGDRKVYIDLRFFDLLRERFKAPGDMAQAYVIAHEVGHHVQNLLGTMDKVQAARGRMSEQQYNQLSVRLELQADCYAGVWANHSQQAKNWLETGDLEEALGAAAAVGDDNIQRQTQGVVVPESFTHGSAAQRARWFKVGFQSGDLRQCDTFSAR
mgnify:FL=1